MGAAYGTWGTQTLIAGLTQDALIARWVIKGAMDGPAFAAYSRELLVPEIAPATIGILDNLTSTGIMRPRRLCATTAAGCSTCRSTRPI